MLTGKEILTLIGSKFYRYDEDENLEIIRVVGMQNSETIKIKHEDGTIEKVDPNTIVYEGTDWRRVVSDALIMFNVVTIKDGRGGNMPDVIILLHRRKDLDDGNNIPYCVCRQNVNDIFFEYMNPNPGVVYAGCCVSIDTVPDGIDYRIMTQCDAVEYTYGVNAYMEDTLDDILDMVKAGKFDKALEAVYTQYFHAYSTDPFIMRANKLNGKSLHGRCKTLRQLLTENNFMYDFNAGFGIHPIGFELEFKDDSKEELSSICAQALSQIIRANIKNTVVVEYSKQLDLDKIGMRYCLVKTPSNKMYVVGFTADGDFIESREALDSIMSKMHGVAIQGYADKYK